MNATNQKLEESCYTWQMGLADWIVFINYLTIFRYEIKGRIVRIGETITWVGNIKLIKKIENAVFLTKSAIIWR